MLEPNVTFVQYETRSNESNKTNECQLRYNYVNSLKKEKYILVKYCSVRDNNPCCRIVENVAEKEGSVESVNGTYRYSE